MKVFSIFFHPNPSWSAFGGAEKRFVETLKNFDEGDLKFTILESEPSLLKRFKYNHQVYMLPFLISSPTSKKSWLNTYFDWILWILRACIKSLKIIQNDSYNLILSPNNTAPSIIPAYFVSRMSHLPLYIIVHHLDLPSPSIKPTFHNIYNIYRCSGFSRPVSLLKTLAFLVIIAILRSAEICIAISRSTATLLSNIGVPEERIHLSGNGVDIDYIEGFKFEGEKEYEGVFVGRISREKGIFDLVRAWKRIVQTNREARLIIIGSGLDLMELNRTVKELDLENNIIIKGPCSDRDMYTLMKGSKVFIFPSRFEGWGLAVAEALACGLPVVCYDIPALHEVFQGCASVFLVPLGNIDMLASTTLRLLEMKETRELAEISKKYVKRFSWKKVAKRDLEIIKLSKIKDW
ncbi:MAG: glycosyltransferase, partial [Candidatus Bathyarchaeia archaeon]